MSIHYFLNGFRSVEMTMQEKCLTDWFDFWHRLVYVVEYAIL